MDASRARPVVFLFNHGILRGSDLRALRDVLVQSRRSVWVDAVLRELPKYAEALAERIPELRSTSSFAVLHHISDWLHSDGDLRLSNANAVTAPLLVLYHLLHHAQRVGYTSDHVDVPVNLWDGWPYCAAAVGSGPGLLSAYAVALCTSAADWLQFSGVAIRIAMLAGLIIDAKDELNPSIAVDSPMQSLSAFLDDRTLIDAQQGLDSDRCGLMFLELLISFCKGKSKLQLPDAGDLRIIAHSKTSAQPVEAGALHEIALRAILKDSKEWHQITTSVSEARIEGSNPLLVNLCPGSDASHEFIEFYNNPSLRSSEFERPPLRPNSKPVTHAVPDLRSTKNSKSLVEGARRLSTPSHLAGKPGPQKYEMTANTKDGMSPKERKIGNASLRSADTTNETNRRPGLPTQMVFGALSEVNHASDEYIRALGCDNYVSSVCPRHVRLSIALTLEAFEQLGCRIADANAGDKLQRVPHATQHHRFVSYLYDMLETDSGLITIDETGQAFRTATPAPKESSEQILKGLGAECSDYQPANALIHHCGRRLASVLQGKTSGIQLVFEDPRGRELVSSLYSDFVLSRLVYKQMDDLVSRLVASFPRDQGPLRILEVGAGTGGATAHMVSILEQAGIPVEYTFTDIAPIFVSAAQRRYKQHRFMRYRTLDIVGEPPADLRGTQHLVLASNAVHATRDLAVSTASIRRLLQPGGCLMLVEMTGAPRWVNMVFGMLEGWWLFDDGRTHATVDERHWQRVLLAAGFQRVEWTDGELPENRLQKVIVAQAPSSDD